MYIWSCQTMEWRHDKQVHVLLSFNLHLCKDLHSSYRFQLQFTTKLWMARHKIFVKFKYYAIQNIHVPLKSRILQYIMHNLHLYG